MVEVCDIVLGAAVFGRNRGKVGGRGSDRGKPASKRTYSIKNETKKMKNEMR